MTSTTAINILSFIQQFSSYSNYIIFTIGITGNILNILVFTGLKTFRNNQCAFYLTTEAISNIIQLIISFLVRILITLYGTDPTGSVLFWCKLRGIIIILCTVISFSAVCFAAFDQYLSTNHQFYLREKSTIKLAKTLVLIATGFSLLHIIPFAVFVKIQGSSCLVFDPTMSNYLSYFYYPVLTGILPIFIASLFSFFAYQNVRRIVRRQVAIVRRRLDRQSTAMVLIRVIVFVILTLPYAIQRAYAYIIKVDQSNLLAYAIVTLVSVLASSSFNLNYAISFYVFLASSTRFRRQVRHVLFKKYWRRWCSCHQNQVDPNVELRPVDSIIELD